MNRTDRRRQILEAYAAMLETHPGKRVTTAALASEINVSEAALYRHFPTKAKMIDGLIDFAEETIFSRVGKIVDGAQRPPAKCRGILLLLLSFCETNPGFARVFVGDALIGETPRLQARVRQFFDRIETQLRQLAREAHAVRPQAPPLGPNACANLLLASAEGRIAKFVRTEFKALPTEDWAEQWTVLESATF
ncbi:MAG: nucleoid occlusion factor SlmA [Gammaproteobacteria bacterium]|nr:nucleoid occlusion factor SlmA [Gammaproteobacteria bacterium]